MIGMLNMLGSKSVSAGRDSILVCNPLGLYKQAAHENVFIMDGDNDSYGIVFIARVSGTLNLVNIGAHTASLAATGLNIDVFADSTNGIGPSSTQVGSRVTVSTPSGADGSVFSFDLTSGSISVTEGNRYWIVFSLTGRTAGSINFRGSIQEAIKTLDRISDCVAYRVLNGGAWGYVSLTPSFTYRIGSTTFGLPWDSPFGAGSGTTILSTTFGNALAYLPGFSSHLNVAGLRLFARPIGTPGRDFSFLLRIGGKDYTTLSIPCPSSVLPSATWMFACGYFQTPVFIPSGARIGVGLVGTGESSGNTWNMGFMGLHSGAVDVVGWREWVGWTDINGTIVQNRFPLVDFILDPTDPFPSELNRRQFFNAR